MHEIMTDDVVKCSYYNNRISDNFVAWCINTHFFSEKLYTSALDKGLPPMSQPPTTYMYFRVNATPAPSRGCNMSGSELHSFVPMSYTCRNQIMRFSSERRITSVRSFFRLGEHQACAPQQSSYNPRRRRPSFGHPRLKVYTSDENHICWGEAFPTCVLSGRMTLAQHHHCLGDHRRQIACPLLPQPLLHAF
mmetsp:Transcript_37714/g.60540  ORF Transcript_37714/g.60540 Transcript_37714/m.60540 type:complete len:192 (-) Transcript_37714:403-978(-)